MSSFKKTNLSVLLVILLCGSSLFAQSKNNLAITANDYCEFLNAVASSDSQNFYDEKMESDLAHACVTRAGEPGAYSYQAISGKEQAPISFVSSFDEVQYCNWKNNAALTSTNNFNLAVDNQLKSNQRTFQLINLSAASYLAKSSAEKGESLEKILEEVGVVLAIAAGGESSGTLDADGDVSLHLQENPIHEGESVGSLHEGTSAVDEAVKAIEVEVSEAAAKAYAARNQAESQAIGTINSFWDEAIEKAGQAAIAYEPLIEIYHYAHNEAPVEQKASWIRKMEEAENEKKHWAANAFSYEMKKVTSANIMFMTSMASQNVQEGTDLWKEAIQKANVMKLVLNQVEMVNQEGFEQAPAWAKPSWARKIEAQTATKTAFASPIANWNALEAKSHAEAAFSRIAKVADVDAEALWDEVIQKTEATKLAFDHFFETSKKVIKQYPAQDNAAFRKHLETINNTRNIWALKTVWRDAKKKEFSAGVAISRAEHYQPSYSEEAAFLWEESVQKVLQLVTAYGQAVESCKIGLDEAPERLKTSWGSDLKSLEKSKATWSDNVLWCKKKKEKSLFLYHPTETEAISLLARDETRLNSSSFPIKFKGELINEGNDCFINSSLQLVKTLGVLPTPEMSMPRLSKFLRNESRMNSDDRQLRIEMANKVMASHQEFHDVVDNITNFSNHSAGIQQDADAFLRLLLEKIQMPGILFRTKLTNQTTRAICLGQSEASILPLTLPALQEIDGILSMQELVDKSVVCTAEGYDWIEGDKNTQTTITKESKLSHPSPASLIVSIGRFNSDRTKRKDVIQGIFDTIAFPLENGEDAFYQAKAIICHLGDSLHEGHYICYRKDGNQWWKLDDDKVTKVMKFEGEDYENIQQNSYLISFIERDALDKKIKAAETKANEAVREVYLALDQAKAAPIEEEITASYWRNAMEKAPLVEKAYEYLTKCYKEASYQSAQEQKAFWTRKIEEASNEEDYWTSSDFRYSVINKYRIALNTLKKITAQDIIEETALWEGAMRQVYDLELNFNALKEIDQGSLEYAPEWAKEWWSEKIKAQEEEIDMKEASWAIASAASNSFKAKCAANAAFNEASLHVGTVDAEKDAGPLWDDAIKKAEATKLAYDQFIETRKQWIEDNSEKDSAFVRKHLEVLENIKNIWALKTLWWKAQKQDAITYLIHDRAKARQAAYSVEITALWDGTMREALKAKQAYSQAIEFCKEGQAQAAENLKASWILDLESLEEARATWNINLAWYKKNTAERLARSPIRVPDELKSIIKTPFLLESLDKKQDAEKKVVFNISNVADSLGKPSDIQELSPFKQVQMRKKADSKARALLRKTEKEKRLQSSASVSSASLDHLTAVENQDVIAGSINVSKESSEQLLAPLIEQNRQLAEIHAKLVADVAERKPPKTNILSTGLAWVRNTVTSIWSPDSRQAAMNETMEEIQSQRQSDEQGDY